jgi:hypothetical protein
MKSNTPLNYCSSCDCESPCETPQPHFPQKPIYEHLDRKIAKGYKRVSKCDGCDCEAPCESMYTKNNK